MDLFEKIEQFEKMANELPVLDDNAVESEPAETIEEYTSQHMERRTASKKRMQKLTILLNR